MATGANIREDYSISEPRTGSARVSRLKLTGWGGTPSSTVGLKTWSDQGRMWGVISGTDFSLRRRGPGVYVSGDEVCSGTISGGKVTLSADNTSGITGTCDVDNGTPGTNPTEDGTFDVIVGYDCDENDLRDMFTQANNLLVSNAWEGSTLTRFEPVLLKAKRILDDWLVRDMRGRMAGHEDAWGRWPLASIVEPGNLRDVQAAIACHLLEQNRSAIDPSYQVNAGRAAQLWKTANELFKSAQIAFDWERDLAPDVRNNAGNVRIYRC